MMRAQQRAWGNGVDGSARLVFLSHASADTAAAVRLVADLEERGVACWISGRDVQPGANFQEAIVGAVRTARAVVFLLTEASNRSDEVRKELALASGFKVPVIPVRFGAVEPAEALRYELATRQWVEAGGDTACVVPALLAALGGADPPAAAVPTRDSAPALPDKPSIAVLPFANLGTDPEQGYFVDGMTEEIATALARIRSIFVVAVTSTRSLDTASLGPSEVGRRLGVRYLLEGSVRRAADRVRITVKLIDAATGTQIWANRYDDVLDDVFALQDRVALSVAGVIEPTVLEAEIKRAVARPTAYVGAYDLYLQAVSLIDSYERAAVFAALERLERAIAIDPRFARAVALVGYAHAQIVVTGWTDDAAPHRRLAIAFAGRAVQMAGDDAEVLAWVAATYLPLAEQVEAAIALIDRSLELNAGCAMAWMMSGWLRAAVGAAERAIADFQTAMRLDPCSTDRGYQLSGMALAKFDLGHYSEAVRLLTEANHLQPAVSINAALLAACHGHLGQLEAAHAALANYRRLSTIEIRHRTSLFQRPDHRAAFLAGIALAEG